MACSRSFFSANYPADLTIARAPRDRFVEPREIIRHDGVGIHSNRKAFGQLEGALFNPFSLVFEVLAGDVFETTKERPPHATTNAMIEARLRVADQLAGGRGHRLIMARAGEKRK